MQWPMFKIDSVAVLKQLIPLPDEENEDIDDVKLVKAGIPHIVLSGDNSDVIDGDMIRRICEGEFRAVFMSPEIIFGDSPTLRLVRGLWQNTRWRNLLLAIVVDEVHCVEKWGNKFRPEYARLCELRIRSPGVPFVGVTATLTDDALTQTLDKLFLSKANILRVQEIPTNVRLEVHTQPKDAKKGLNRLPDLQGKMGVYFSTLTSQYKEAAMIKFTEGDIHILLATEAAGMGCGIPDVVQVIWYGDIPSLVQRFGRAARDPKVQGFGVLYAPPITKTSPSDKNVRDYLMNQLAGRCLWTLLDDLFGKKARSCDNSCSGCSKLDRPVPTTVCYDTRSRSRRWPSRSEEEKRLALKRLQEWRKDAYEKWVITYPYKRGSETWMLPDNIAKQLSQKFSGARTAKAVKAIASSWTPLGGENRLVEVAQVLDKLNNEIDARRGSGSQTTAASALDQLEDDSDGDREGSDGEEDLLE
ncbi:ATP-dependent DNA helicase sgs1 [Mortierella polycephala]|uniref:DNA 3'-5' helicase n=1 Tax=Mortierella polycephala TaxID=41804 RepID=A0A9P6PSC3_9FUNG|nr:ATP-dependent DNA helicase sgs1 [Mortierella polycephala]